jgi:cytochrome c peroxidase
MKPSLLSVIKPAAASVLILLGMAQPAAAQTTNASLTIVPSSAHASIKVSDPGNYSWSIQTSTDFKTWSEVEKIKVFNGFYQCASKAVLPGNVFYRALFDVPGIESSVANALGLPATAYNYANPILPPQFLVPPIINQDNTPTTNPTTDLGATLGRVLFYDRRLSTNQTIACASCHQQSRGFSDGRKFSLGFAGGLTGRNSMGLSNARYYLRARFFWDERAATLEDQVLQPIQNAVEMGMTLPALRARIAAEPYYNDLFTRAYGSAEVTDQKISRSLAQFVRSIISVKSKYDQGVATRFANFSAQENLGRQIFFGQVGRATCAACHGTDNFVPGPTINNNGLENPYVDKGVGGITGLARDEGLFKVPSLRNIELTAPYMHDGRFATLEEVVEFYNSGIVDHPNLSPPLRVPPPPGAPPGAPPGPPLRLNLTAGDKAALVAFLKTLTDTSLATDAKYSDPFNYGN